MVLSDLDIAYLNESNTIFIDSVVGDVDVPVYQCNPAKTAETARLLSQAGFRCYCPYFTAPVRKNRHSKQRVDMPFLYFSGYIFVLGKSPKDMFPDRVTRLRFADQFASIAFSDLIQY